MPLLTMSLTTSQATRSSQTLVSLIQKVLVMIKVFIELSVSGKKTTMMSTRNFYNAMTPGSYLVIIIIIIIKVVIIIIIINNPRQPSR